MYEISRSSTDAYPYTVVPMPVYPYGPPVIIYVPIYVPYQIPYEGIRITC